MIIIRMKDYTLSPGGRDTLGGASSGECFYNDVLKPKFELAVKSGDSLLVDLDNVEGYSTAFINGSFGKLAQNFPVAQIQAILKLQALDDPFIEVQVERQFTSFKPLKTSV